MKNIFKKILAIPASLCFFVPSSFAMGMEGDAKDITNEDFKGFTVGYESRDGIKEGECIGHSMCFDENGNGIIRLMPDANCKEFRVYLLKKIFYMNIPYVRIYRMKQGNSIAHLDITSWLNVVKGEDGDEVISLTIDGKVYTFSSSIGSALRYINHDYQKNKDDVKWKKHVE